MRAFLVALIVLTGSTAVGEVYRYTDVKGELHFVDDLSKVPARYRKRIKTEKDLPVVSVVAADSTSPKAAAKPSAAPAEPAVSPNSVPPVEIFVTSWCGYCRKLEQFLSGKGIPFRKFDIETDSAAAEVHAKLGGGGVPVSRIGNSVVRGFNPDAIMKHLGKK